MSQRFTISRGRTMANKRKDITGNKYGKLTAIKPLRPNEKGLWVWLLECECGKEIERCVTFVSKIRDGVISSCGCDHHLRKHSLSGVHKKLHWVWVAMRQRCSNANNKDYHNYGGRGISICEEWDDYAVFVVWAMSNGYKDKVTIERIDVNGDYCPKNCTWVVNEKQALNTRKIRQFDYRGEMLTYRQLSVISGLKINTLKTRLNTLGWSVERAMGDTL